MKIKRVNPQRRKNIDKFIKKSWFSLDMILRGETVNLEKADGFYMTENRTIMGLITYRIRDGEAEILSLDSCRENEGIGTALLNAAIAEVKQKGCRRIVLITTNDNTRALRFYQKRGFDIVCFYRNALAASRKLKPEIPLSGIDGIPLRHEIELEMTV